MLIKIYRFAADKVPPAEMRGTCREWCAYNAQAGRHELSQDAAYRYKTEQRHGRKRFFDDTGRISLSIRDDVSKLARVPFSPMQRARCGLFD